MKRMPRVSPARPRPLRIGPVALVVALVAAASNAGSLSGQDAANDSNPRFGTWLLESDAPPPARNVMTYEAYGDGGMRVTVASTNGDGETTTWGYVTMFDGIFRPVEGREDADTAVEVVDERTNRITNRRGGRVTQIIINVLSEDGNAIHNEYRSVREDGTERVSHAVYRRIGS